MPRKARLALWILLCVALAMLPYAMYPLVGDRYIYRNYMECFSRQFWQGDFYPRWCFDANGGTGAPVFLFYFPLGYWFAALLSPLANRLSDYATFALFMAIFLSLGGVGVYRWLREFFAPRIAALGVFFYLLYPYVSELLLRRLAYAEIVCFALMPFLLTEVTRMAQGKRYNPVACIALIALTMLAHLTAALAGLIGMGIYVMITTRLNPKIIGCWIAWCALAIGLCAFYLIPAVYYHQFILPMPPESLNITLPNRAIRLNDFTAGAQGLFLREIINFVIGALLLSSVWLLAMPAKNASKDAALRRELAGWGAAALFAALTVAGLGWWMWAMVPPLRYVLMPWRMQIVLAWSFAFAASAYFAARQSRIPARPWKGDAILLMAMLLMAAQFSVRSLKENQEEIIALNRSLMKANGFEYQSRWTDYSHNVITFYQQVANEATRVKHESGDADAEIEQWNAEGIILKISARGAAHFVLTHHYFPSFEMKVEGPIRPLFLPQEGTGFMQVDIPSAGEYRVAIRHAPYEINTAPWVVRCSPWISLLTLVSVFIAGIKGGYFSVAMQKRRAYDAPPIS